MKDLGILNELEGRQLDEVKHAVKGWVDAGEPGIFGFMSVGQLDEIGTRAVKAYKEKLVRDIAYVAIPTCLINTVVILGYNKLKKRKNKEQK